MRGTEIGKRGGVQIAAAGQDKRRPRAVVVRGSRATELLKWKSAGGPRKKKKGERKKMRQQSITACSVEGYESFARGTERIRRHG